jgi:hypothetical protein
MTNTYAIRSSGQARRRARTSLDRSLTSPTRCPKVPRATTRFGGRVPSPSSPKRPHRRAVNSAAPAEVTQCSTPASSSPNATFPAPRHRSSSMWWIPTRPKHRAFHRARPSTPPPARRAGRAVLAYGGALLRCEASAHLGLLAPGPTHRASPGAGRRLSTAAQCPCTGDLWTHRRRHLVRGRSDYHSGRRAPDLAIIQ